jgi:hypothetical protein
MRKTQKLLLKKPKKKKSWLANKFFWFFILFILLVGTAGYFLLFHSFFKIKTLNINNRTEINTGLLKNSIYQHLNNDHWFFVPKNSIVLIGEKEIVEELTKEYPQLKNIILKRKIYPPGLSVTVEMRKPMATWCFGEEVACFLIDEDGVIFEKAKKETTSSSPPLILTKASDDSQLGDRIYSPQSIRQISAINQTFKTQLNLPLKNFLVDETSFLVVITQEGWETYFDLDGDVDTALLKLQALLKQELSKSKRSALQYIDLRFSKVYYK